MEGAGLFDRFVEGPATVRALIDAIGRAKTDRRVKGLVVEPVGGAPFWARSQEIRDAILDFRKSGKKTIAYLEYGGEQEYFLATACEKVVLLPSSVLDLKGLATYEVFLRGAFDKIGVTPDFIHIGDYKTAINTFTQKTFTPAHREMTTSLNHDAFDQLVQAIAVARKKSPETVRALIDEGPFIAEDALAAGLVDALLYRDEVEEHVGLGDEDTTDFSDYVQALPPTFTLSARPKIAVIYAVGTIASGEGRSGDVAGSDTLVEYINQAADDRGVKAIVLRVDSPGGSSIASDVIWRALMLAREDKPLIVSMGDLAASGGYYIAMPGHVIVAQPGTLTGSIGIYTGKFAIGGTLEKLGAVDRERVRGQDGGARFAGAAVHRRRAGQDRGAGPDLLRPVRGQGRRGAQDDAGEDRRGRARPRVDRPAGEEDRAGRRARRPRSGGGHRQAARQDRRRHRRRAGALPAAPVTVRRAEPPARPDRGIEPAQRAGAVRPLGAPRHAPGPRADAAARAAGTARPHAVRVHR